MSKMEKILIFSGVLIFISCNFPKVYGDGIGEFLVDLCNEYPSWLAANYPDPSPELYTPINVTLETSSEGDHVNATFTNYQMFWHTNPENWEFTNWDVDLSAESIQVIFRVRNTKFSGKYEVEGVYNGVPITGKGTWNISTPYPSYIAFSVHYYGVKVTEDDYVDLNAEQAESLYYYVPLAGVPSVREMDGLVAGAQETLLRNDLFNALEMQTQYMKDHPLPIPLNTYLQVAFATTPISEMRKLAEKRNHN